MSEPWTIDSIAHALPHPELRAAFMRDATFTEVGRLPGVLGRWQRLIEGLDAERPRVDEIRDYYREHGQLPPEHEETAESADRFDAWRQRMEALREGRHVA